MWMTQRVPIPSLLLISSRISQKKKALLLPGGENVHQGLNLFCLHEQLKRSENRLNVNSTTLLETEKRRRM